MRHGLLAILVLSGSTCLAQCDGCDVDQRFADRLFTELQQPWCRPRAEPEGPIETDRHDFTQSSRTVGRGVAQVESGYSFFYKDDEEEIDTTHVTPELAFRYGVTDRVEVKLRFNYAWRFAHEDADDAEDMRISTKIAILEPAGWIPETALVLRGSVPTGGQAWTTDAFQPGFSLIYTWEPAERVTFSAQSGANDNGAGDVSLEEANLEGERRDQFVAWSQSAALGLPLSESNELYLEWFGIWSYGLEDEFVQNYVNVGIDHLVTDDFVLDFRIGKGLTNDSEDFFVGAGGGVRY